ncbi:cytochrome c3 family protein [Bacillus sp. ISL-75]|uniref:cytochrome c3 family protein n=1 Tax=Bacillus sp. ISL-75 TaxID=2819137 RepID=UPI001BE6DA21|nr:cytochrome c3 family protein [Bacillus sp. ISL-75]MBT2729635.1 cytochrome c3 family protein [Bacillus sp. ISL-75]
MRKFSLGFLLSIMMVFMFAAAASAASDANNNPGNHNAKMNPGTKGTSLENANDTANGVDTNDGTTASTVRKNLAGHNTHTSYQNNTNSCASCHQTHTAKGDQLLFADGVYQTCTACHDGTLGFYNVFSDGSLTATSAKTTGAGTFGGSHGSSMHMANDTVKINAAPGGNPLGDADKTKGTMWGESFNCASCHAPHGSYSDRLLQYNPNGIGAMPASQGGMQLENVPVVDALPAVDAAAPAVVLLRTEDAVADANGHKKVTVAQYNKGASTYTKSTSPWLYGYDNRTNGLTYWSRLVKSDDTIAAYGSTSGVYFSYDHAEAYSTSTAGADALKTAGKGFLARPVVVKMAKNGFDVVQSAYFAGAPLAQFGGKTEQQLKDLGYKVGTDTDKTVTNVGVQMSKFCAACHTDYLQASSDGKKSHFGTATEAYRHSTNSDSYTCVRCHYSHGTDAYIMKDSLGRTIADLTATGGQYEGNEAGALGYMQDNNASSALKKFTNMSVCWACHNSSHAETIKNTERNADHPVGMPTGN